MNQSCFRLPVWLALVGVIVAGCAPAADSQRLAERNILAAEVLIDAFYSFDPLQLQPLMANAEGSRAALNFYQGWAEGGNYKVLERRDCVAESATLVSCAITVEDDPVLALGIDFKVTDTFKMTFEDATLVAVENSSNDQPAYYEAYNWVVENMPEVMAGPCKGFFVDGPTPGDCARAMTEGYRRFSGLQK